MKRFEDFLRDLHETDSRMYGDDSALKPSLPPCRGDTDPRRKGVKRIEYTPVNEGRKREYRVGEAARKAANKARQLGVDPDKLDSDEYRANLTQYSQDGWKQRMSAASKAHSMKGVHRIASEKVKRSEENRREKLKRETAPDLDRLSLEGKYARDRSRNR